jgi:hypothetical protein
LLGFAGPSLNHSMGFSNPHITKCDTNLPRFCAVRCNILLVFHHWCPFMESEWQLYEAQLFREVASYSILP